MPLGEIVREAGGDHALQEEPGARRAEPQEPRHGTAAPGPLHVGLAARLLEGRGIGPGAARAIDHQGAMAVPPPVVGHVGPHGSAHAGSSEAKAVEGECRAGLTVGRCPAAQA